MTAAPCRRPPISGVLPLFLTLPLLLPLMTGCSGTPSVAATAPSPVATDAAGCDRLSSLLPRSLGSGLASRTVRPSVPWVHAWGRPAIVLRCGVGLPADYAKDARVDAISGVAWFASQGKDDVTFTAVLRLPRVAVSVPRSYGQALDVLGALGGPVQDATRARVG